MGCSTITIGFWYKLVFGCKFTVIVRGGVGYLPGGGCGFVLLTIYIKKSFLGID